MIFSIINYRYIQCMHQKLYHLTAGEYEDFVNVVCAARAAFHITPEGHVQFKERLQSIKRYYLTPMIIHSTRSLKTII